jgi:hypothetical protein
MGVDPLALAIEYVKEPGEMQRRKKAQRRVDLYLDNSEKIIEQEIHSVFKEPAVQERLKPFVKMAASQSLLKRIVDEQARPVYSTPPRRVVGPGGGQADFNALAAECRLNEKMDLACRLVHACNTVWLYYRFTPRLGVVLDVLTPNMVTVIPDPDDPTRELALIYDRRVRIDGKEQVAHVYWDDAETFTFLSDGTLLPDVDGVTRRQHDIGRIPFVTIHKRERWGTFHDVTGGNDIEAGTVAGGLLIILSLKLLKSQGERQLVVMGDIHGFPKGQILDGESAIVAPEGTSIDSLDMRSDATHYIQVLDAITNTVANNHGVNRDRLDAKSGDLAGDIGLLERRADAIRIFWRAEQDGFDVLKRVSREHPAYRLPQDAKLEVDFGEIHHRTDRKTQLEIREAEERRGLRSILDDIMEDQPEITTEDAAWDEYNKNLGVFGRRIQMVRALQIPADAGDGYVGQDAAANGALGPLVRDGKISRDQAADASLGDIDRLKQIAKRVLGGGK